MLSIGYGKGVHQTRLGLNTWHCGSFVNTIWNVKLRQAGFRRRRIELLTVCRVVMSLNGYVPEVVAGNLQRDSGRLCRGNL